MSVRSKVRVQVGTTEGGLARGADRAVLGPQGQAQRGALAQHGAPSDATPAVCSNALFGTSLSVSRRSRPAFQSKRPARPALAGAPCQVEKLPPSAGEPQVGGGRGGGAAGHDLHHPRQGVGAVEAARRAPHHLHPLVLEGQEAPEVVGSARRVDGHAVEEDAGEARLAAAHEHRALRAEAVRRARWPPPARPGRGSGTTSSPARHRLAVQDGHARSQRRRRRIRRAWPPPPPARAPGRAPARGRRATSDAEPSRRRLGRARSPARRPPGVLTGREALEAVAAPRAGDQGAAACGPDSVTTRPGEPPRRWCARRPGARLAAGRRRRSAARQKTQTPRGDEGRRMASLPLQGGSTRRRVETPGDGRIDSELLLARSLSIRSVRAGFLAPGSPLRLRPSPVSRVAVLPHPWRRARRLQWRDRAGFRPASLLAPRVGGTLTYAAV